jgi:hypothetical protein
MQILIDFDATVVSNDYPFMGDEIPGAVRILKRLRQEGHDLILFTMRADNLLDDALEWFKNRDIELFAVNSNPMFETGSRKIYGHVVIDDHNLGIPLTHDLDFHKKPFVDWESVEDMLIAKGVLMSNHKPLKKAFV